MAYIGRQNLGGAYRQLDDISSGFDGSDTTHTMQVNSANVTVGDVNQIILSLGGVIQKPGTDFTVSGSVLTFTTAPAANTSFFAVLLGSDNGGTVTPTDASVTVSKLAIAGGEVKLDADGDTSITADTDDQIDFKTGGTDRLTIQSTSGNNVVVADGLTLTDGNLIVASGHGIDFSATGDGAVSGLSLTSAMSSELFDDYEEGTYTPTVGGSTSGSFGLSTNSDTLQYTKVGRVVHVQGMIGVTSDSSVNGGVIVALPYTAPALTDDSDYAMGTLAIANHGNSSMAGNHYTFVLPGNYAYLYAIQDGGTPYYITQNEVDAAFQFHVNVTYVSE